MYSTMASRMAMRAARVSLARRKFPFPTRSGEHISGGTFMDREKALENKAIYEHELKLIEQLRANLQEKERAAAKMKPEDIVATRPASNDLDVQFELKKQILQRLETANETVEQVRQRLLQQSY